jgi:catechol-2,3-dioxygenase
LKLSLGTKVNVKREAYSALMSNVMLIKQKEDRMETQELHRGRLIDHIQLVVRDISAARRFYTAVFESLNIPISGSGDDYFWADELFISTPDSEPRKGY